MSSFVALPLEWPLVGEHLGRLGLAFALALPLGWERGKGHHSAGFRTMPVVAMASCGYTLLATRLPGADAESMTRVLQGVLAGIGFIGGGAILKQSGHVRGLVTAATVWNTGAVGVSVALGRIEVALALSVANLLVLVALTPLREPLDPPEDSDAPS